MRGAFRIAVGFVLLGAAGALLAPATLADRVLAARTQQRLRIADAQGLWWHGSGSLAAADGGARVPLGWRVALVPLLHGALVVDLAADGDGPLSGRIRMQHGAVNLRDVHARMPAAVALESAPTTQAFAWGGDLDVQVATFAWDGRNASGKIDARWNAARIVAGTLALDLGTVTLSSIPEAGDALRAVVHNRGGDVAVDGTLADRDGAIHVALSLAPAPTAPEAVRQVLPLLGTRDAEGRVQIRWRSGP